MAEQKTKFTQPAANEESNRARDHLANERTFLAWVRTAVALVVFGFAIGRFAIAIRQFMQFQGRTTGTAGITVWFGTIAIVAGVLASVAGLLRYRKTRAQLESGQFQPAGFVIDLVGILVALFGLTLAGYLIYIELRL
jgi:putative membrane protein